MDRDPRPLRRVDHRSSDRATLRGAIYVAVDRPDDAHHVPHPADNPDATARSVLYGVIQHVGAELSAHATITAEQEHWGGIAQLAAEYETIAQAAQHDRWATLLSASGLTAEDVEAVLDSDAYGALSAELRHAEANHRNLDELLPRLVSVRGFADAEDIASVLHARLAWAKVRPAGPAGPGNCRVWLPVSSHTPAGR